MLDMQQTLYDGMQWSIGSTRQTRGRNKQYIIITIIIIMITIIIINSMLLL